MNHSFLFLNTFRFHFNFNLKNKQKPDLFILWWWSRLSCFSTESLCVCSQSPCCCVALKLNYIRLSCGKCVREPLSAEANTLCLPPVSFFLYHHHPAGWNSRCGVWLVSQKDDSTLFLTWTFTQISQTHCQEAFGHSCCCLEIQHHMCLWNRQKYNCSNLYLTSVTWSLMTHQMFQLHCRSAGDITEEFLAV